MPLHGAEWASCLNSIEEIGVTENVPLICFQAPEICQISGYSVLDGNGQCGLMGKLACHEDTAHDCAGTCGKSST